MKKVINKILLATDFSDASQNATYYALSLAKIHNAKLKVLHVFDARVLGIPADYFITDEQENIEKTRQRGKENLARLVDSFDIKVETIFAEGIAGREIIRIAADSGADLIILGTHGYTGWNRFAIGSIAEFVVRYSPCPVLTVPSNQEQ